MTTAASAGPARLPSKTRTATPLRSLPSSRASTSACPMSAPSGQPYTLLVQVGQPPARIVSLLERLVRGPVVPPPELLGRVVHGRVQRLVAIERGHRLLDEPVVVPVRLPRPQRHTRPEPHVDVQLVRLPRVQRPGPGRPQPHRTQPHGRDADLAVEEVEELGRPCHGYLDVLDHRLLG